MKKKKWTDNDLDKAYILGVFNTGGLDALDKELKRLKELNAKPHQIIEWLQKTK